MVSIATTMRAQKRGRRCSCLFGKSSLVAIKVATATTLALFCYGTIVARFEPSYIMFEPRDTKPSRDDAYGGSTPQFVLPPTATPAATTTTTKSNKHSSTKMTATTQGRDLLDEATTFIPQRTPTHSACRDDSVQGIYHIAMGDIGGAAGTIFFQFVIAQILYAERHGLKPWVHLSNVSHVVYDTAVHGGGGVGTTAAAPAAVVMTELTAMVGRNATYYRRRGGHHRDATPGPPDAALPVAQQTLQFPGTGVWEHYFEPVSDFVPGDTSCATKLYVTMDLYLITPGLHGYADYAPRCWRYQYMPDYVTKPHLGLAEWLAPQRQAANAVVRRYIRPRPYLQAAAARVNPDCGLLLSSSNHHHPCLGLHIRHSDKASGRRVIETAEFLPYAQAFLAAAAAAVSEKDAGATATIYLATDSTLVLQEIERTWPAAVRASIRTAGDNLLRSSNDVAVFDLEDGASHHHRTNQEALIEILALSACQFLVHGFSAVSEAAVWMGLHLDAQSVNLEDPDRLNVAQFETLVKMVVAGNVSRDQWPRPIRSVDVWPELFAAERSKSEYLPTPTNKACEGFDGVLLISSVGRTASAGAGFFTSVLNQLAFADKHNLKPWVHLRSSSNTNTASNALLYDEKIHGAESTNGRRVVFEMMQGMAVSIARLDENDATTIYPNVPAKRDKELSQKVFSVEGNGIWNSYFEPVSDFVPGDESCRSVPLIEMEEVLVSPGLEAFAPWSVRAWRYDKVPDTLWWGPKQGGSLKDWYEPMHALGSELFQKYYRFRPFIVDRAEQINPAVTGQPCLGIHLRNGDKFGQYREKIIPKKFEPYVDAFERAGGRCVYIATDSHRVLKSIFRNFSDRVTKLMRSQGDYVVRSTKLDWPAHYLEDHHRVNSEVLVDILALSKCQMLLHGFSTVSEAAIYVNPTLHSNSVNLEDPDRMDPDDFEKLAKRVIASAS